MERSGGKREETKGVAESHISVPGSRFDLTVVHEGRDANLLASCVKFSPDGLSLAVKLYSS